MSVRSALELLSAAYTVHSGFAEGRILESGAQCRPSFKNNLPQIIQSNAKLMHVNGLYRHGYLIAPAIVDSVLAILLNNNESLAHQFQLANQESSHAHLC
jgi:glycine oxidase